MSTMAKLRKQQLKELIEAIRKVSTGGRCISSLAKKLLFDLETEQELQLHERLSDRAYRVLCMNDRGKTASTPCGHILEKMKMNAELTNFVITHKLGSLAD